MSELNQPDTNNTSNTAVSQVDVGTQTFGDTIWIEVCEPYRFVALFTPENLYHHKSYPLAPAEPFEYMQFQLMVQMCLDKPHKPQIKIGIRLHNDQMTSVFVGFLELLCNGGCYRQVPLPELTIRKQWPSRSVQGIQDRWNFIEIPAVGLIVPTYSIRVILERPNIAASIVWMNSPAQRGFEFEKPKAKSTSGKQDKIKKCYAKEKKLTKLLEGTD